MSDDEEVTSDEQKLQIATYFIMSTPVGEVDFVVQDTSKLVADKNVFGEAQLTKILQGYNIEHTTTAQTPGGHKCSVSPYGMVSPNEFLDPKSGDVLSFDHTKREFVGVSEKKVFVSEDKSEMREKIEEKVEEYVAAKYKKKQRRCNRICRPR
jgi:capping protein alpha